MGIVSYVNGAKPVLGGNITLDISERLSLKAHVLSWWG